MAKTNMFERLMYIIYFSLQFCELMSVPPPFDLKL